MAFDISSISRGKVRRAPRIVLLGVEKIGKSTWASSAPGAIVLPIKGEEGIDHLDVARFPVVTKLDEALSAIETIAEQPHEHQTFVIDSSSALEPIIWDRVCQDSGVKSIEDVDKGYGKGYVKALNWWRSICDGLTYVRNVRNMTTIVIGHVKVKAFNDPLSDPYDQYQWTINQQAASLLYQWSDMILFANAKTFTKSIGEGPKKVVHANGTPERYLYTQKRPGHPGGGRVTLPYELPLNWEAFATAYAEATK